MALSEEKLKQYTKRLYFSRMRILINNGFYGLLLMHMIIAVDEKCETAATDGYRIYFGPKFMDDLSDSELDFVMMHEILHVVLRHCIRDGERDHDKFNIACDIVVNSNILLSNGKNPKSITIRKYGESIHLTPMRDEGYKYTAEEVYEMLSSQKGKKGSLKSGNTNGQGKESASTINNATGSGGGQGKSGKSALKDKASGSFNLGRAEKKINQSGSQDGWDDHSRWEFAEDDTTMREVWIKRITDAAEAISIRKASNARGTLPMFAQRLIDELKKPQTDWRTILNDFLQEEVCDYSFSPPDRRFGDSPFYLPDFNGTEILPSDILFMIDTSASMSDEMVVAAYSEVNGAIDQFNGKLNGWLGFFDAAIIEPVPFANEDEFRIIKPAGGGGTDFQIIFEYVKFYMSDNPPSCIIILTDGYAPFPDESLANDIPVLWLLNNDEVTPPWGKIARIKI